MSLRTEAKYPLSSLPADNALDPSRPGRKGGGRSGHHRDSGGDASHRIDDASAAGVNTGTGAATGVDRPHPLNSPAAPAPANPNYLNFMRKQGGADGTRTISYNSPVALLNARIRFRPWHPPRCLDLKTEAETHVSASAG